MISHVTTDPQQGLKMSNVENFANLLMVHSSCNFSSLNTFSAMSVFEKTMGFL
jgi:hypothetical protein